MFEYNKYKDVTIASGRAGAAAGGIKICLFLVDGLLIDCGPQSMGADIRKFCLSHEISQLAITHMHEDHCGMAFWIQENLDIPVYLHAGALDEASRDGAHAMFRRAAWGERPAFNARPMPDVIKTGKYSFQAVHTPGHLPHHCAFFEKKQGWLFSGDLFVNPAPRFCSSGENMAQLISSIEKLLTLDFGVMFCAHSGVLENGRELLVQKLNYLYSFREKVRFLRRDGLTDREIDAQLFPSHQGRADSSNGEWSSYNMVRTI